MPRRDPLTKPAAGGAAGKKVSAQDRQPMITLFAIPKPFDGSVDLIQRNAIASWSRLGPHVDVLLLGDGTGIEEIAQQYGVRHSAELAVNNREHLC